MAKEVEVEMDENYKFVIVDMEEDEIINNYKTYEQALAQAKEFVEDGDSESVAIYKRVSLIEKAVTVHIAE